MCIGCNITLGNGYLSKDKVPPPKMDDIPNFEV
jgi:hypothetical protein